MNNWQARLREADPGRDAVMPTVDAQRIRRVVVSAAGERPGRVLIWSRTFVATAAALVLICVSVLASLHRASAEMRQTRVGQGESGVLQEGAGGEAERTQLQFTTPGGTRIIWVFDTQFDVKGTLP